MSSERTAGAIATALMPFMELACVGGRLYLGSMFYLDFGSTFLASARSGERIEIGEMTLSVRDVAWWLYRGKTVVAAAESVSTDQFDNIVRALVGATIAGVKLTDEGYLEIRLGEKYRLLVDLTNMWGTDSDVLELALPDGRIVAVDQCGEFLGNAGSDGERAKHWMTSPNRH